MVRKLKHHEQKLLRKVDFTTYKSDNNHRDAAVIRRYNIQKPADYAKYNRICGVCFLPIIQYYYRCQQYTQSLKQLAHRLAALPPDSTFRRKHEELLLSKLHDMGILPSNAANAKLSEVEKNVTVSSFCRRRLPVVLTRLRMAETVQAATKIIEQGHVRVGTETITDTAFLVTRSMEDFVTWVDGSKIKRNILKYREKLDDFDLL
ncbi:probable IMP3 (component of the U3 small nucleolar ribonucleoprotein) [Rhynchosporium secalis]|uniref:U3 small nucleolar ribonucleoprotein protein IMP3 n=1 Tax=Rhynchosporium secalis TaxID=38038 RepID=A0A1E1LWC2_RHYSE|nr:probable IMP3 (component of the U3 small nucleolar ribonucleoprotein) [Rhynchosporium secalis]